METNKPDRRQNLEVTHYKKDSIMKIRPAKKTDMKSVEQLLSLPELSTATGEYLSADILSGYVDDLYFLIAEKNSEIVGAIFGERLKNNGFMLWEFAVKKEFRGQGIGSALLKKFETNLASENRKWMILYAPAKSPQTINFYQKHGYNKGKSHIEFIKFFD